MPVYGTYLCGISSGTSYCFAAVNYPARAAGITRHMRRAEAKAKCPELQCVHVETIGKDCVISTTHQ